MSVPKGLLDPEQQRVPSSFPSRDSGRAWSGSREINSSQCKSEQLGGHSDKQNSPFKNP